MKKKRLVIILIFPFFMGLTFLLSIGVSQEVKGERGYPTGGKRLVKSLCLFCHSDAAVSRGRVRPWNGIILHLSPKNFHHKVTTGIPPGMPGFPELTTQQTASIYAFLRQEEMASNHPTAPSAEVKVGTSDQAAKEISQSRVEKKLSRSLRCPCCGKFVKDCSCGMIPRIRAEIGRLEKRGLSEKQIKRALAKKYGDKILPMWEISETLSPEPFYQIARAYDVAKKIPQTLEKIGCFCPCYRVGHTNLLDCYKDKHAAGCHICIDEALEAQHLLKQGRPEDEIVSIVHEKYRPKISPELGKRAR